MTGPTRILGINSAIGIGVLSISFSGGHIDLSEGTLLSTPITSRTPTRRRGARRWLLQF